MFENIGEKIKTLAQVFCWIGIICNIILGIVLMSLGSTLNGIIVAVAGAFCSWAGSLMAYGFGQLIENSATMISQNDKILSLQRESAEKHRAPAFAPAAAPAARAAAPAAPASAPAAPADHSQPTHSWRCLSCGKMISSDPCPYCGNSTQQRKNSTAPYWCGKCGNEGPYDGNCPVCGSSVKKFNV